MDDEPDMVMPVDVLAGSWANRVQVHLTSTEFTLDFGRVDPQAREGVWVARLSCAPPTVRQLLDSLDALWRQWVDSTMPPEVT